MYITLAFYHQPSLYVSNNWKQAQEMRRKIGDLYYLYYTGDEMPWMCFGLMRLAVPGDRVQELHSQMSLPKITTQLLQMTKNLSVSLCKQKCLSFF